jgi:hypothetical protein
LGSFDYGAKFQFRPKARNLQKFDFAFCNFLQYYQLASLQGAKKRSCILGKKICRQLPKDSLSFAIVYFGSVPKDGTENSHLSCRQLAERKPQI